MPGQLTKRFDRGRDIVFWIATGFDPRHPDLTMAPSNPVHEKHSFVRGAIEFEDDLFDQRVDQPLLRARIG